MESKKNSTLFSGIIYLSLIVCVLFSAILGQEKLSEVIWKLVYNMLCGTGFLILLHWKENRIYRQIPDKLIYLFAFVAAICLIGAESYYCIGAFWMLPLAVVAFCETVEIRVLTFVMLFTLYFGNALNIQGNLFRFEYYFVAGAAYLLLFSILKKKEEIKYILGILAVLSLAMNSLGTGFAPASIASVKYQWLLQWSSLLFLVCIAGLMSAADKNVAAAGFAASEEDAENHKEHIDQMDSNQMDSNQMDSNQMDSEHEKIEMLEKNAYGEDVKSDKTMETSDHGEIHQETAAMETKNESILETHNLNDYLQEDFSLLLKMKEKKALYRHSCKVSNLSKLAAQTLGCDETLAAAGGMYHEAGRLLREKDYMKANLMIAKEYQFPQNLTSVMLEHNTTGCFPESAEAGIVMLTDCIVSTSEYLEKTGKRKLISDKKLVESIFSNRISQGSLNETGLTLKQLELLKQFYIDYAFCEKIENPEI